ncbi:type II toxin-antitoxin system RelE/ParE family toxin [Rhizobium sp. CG5]|uniref:type II toxin-antitoxin system RelE/ParE family toxin n=1 Tax=Rhizobium sp. CG5 TaxID=2726076 RepID=UPI002033676C|nr:type II toxin-antitoxin system RelE/ParE family toxin [Rhizobium sp. CG5]MCM2474922.1 type II toxin-antitoxin system RelE/ParE family toxin [Rhizobium sp. CG5]
MNGHHYRITPLANRDIEEIGRYTAKLWGRKKRNIYLRALSARFLWLSHHPRAGMERSEFATQVYSYPEGSHVIFYRMIAEGVEILRVLHQRMAPENKIR